MGGNALAGGDEGLLEGAKIWTGPVPEAEDSFLEVAFSFFGGPLGGPNGGPPARCGGGPDFSPDDSEGGGVD